MSRAERILDALVDKDRDEVGSRGTRRILCMVRMTRNEEGAGGGWQKDERKRTRRGQGPKRVMRKLRARAPRVSHGALGLNLKSHFRGKMEIDPAEFEPAYKFM